MTWRQVSTSWRRHQWDGQHWAEALDISQPIEEHIGITFAATSPAPNQLSVGPATETPPPPAVGPTTKMKQTPAVQPATEQSAEVGSNGIPKFYAQARQMLFEASVYDKTGKAGKASITQQVMNDSPQMGKDLMENFPKPTTGLSVKDFQVLDDGAQQSVNYLSEKDFKASDLTHQWILDARRLGTWGTLTTSKIYVDFPAAIYLIGYVPPAVEPGDCHKISASVEGHIVGLNRNGYCNTGGDDAIDKNTREETEVGTQMRAFAGSTAGGSVGVSLRAFVFWSSGVLSLTKEASPTPSSPPLASDTSALVTSPDTFPQPEFTYRIQVHDSKAPASVRVAVQLILPNPHWSYEDCQKHPAVYVLGMIYNTNGEKVKEFGDTYFCTTLSSELAKNLKYPKWWKSTGPSRFETQVEVPPGDYQVRVVASDGKKDFGRAEIPLQSNPLTGSN